MDPVILLSGDLDLPSLIRVGDTVVVGQGTAEPLTLTRRLVSQAGAIGPFTCFLGTCLSDTFAPERCNGIAFRGYGAIGPGGAALSRAGLLDPLPTPYGRLADGFASGLLRADVVLLQLAPPPPGRSGYSLSLANDYVVAAARTARVVVAEINGDAPWTHGALLPDDIRPHVLVSADHPPQELGAARFGETEGRIARHIAGQVPDGACLQFGVGAVPAAALSALGGHRELAIHSGVIGDACIDLVERGVVTNGSKPFDRGVTVTNTVLGTRRLFGYVHDNPAFAVRPASRTHDVPTIARIPHFRAINSAVEVDLTGQINAEVAGGAYVGAVGGINDFVRGALASPGGRSVVALPSTALSGRASRIVARLDTVTVPRCDADLIVTEHGVADLRGATLAERVGRLIAIADPAFREDLARSWRNEGMRRAA